MLQFDITTLTTPDKVDKNVLRFCRSLSKEAPIFVSVLSEPWCRQSCCEMNVKKLIEVVGGEAAIGYKIWYVKEKYVEAERHVVHKSGSTLRDPTFNTDGEQRILFVADDDQSRGYEGRALKIRRGISLSGQRFASQASVTDKLIQRMSEEESWNTMLSYKEWLAGKRMPNVFLKPGS